MSYIHIKLDKIAAGDQKRLFKSSTQIYETQNIIQNNTSLKSNIQPSKNKKLNQVFYGNYSKGAQLNTQTNGYQNSLLSFNKVSQQYISNKNKINVQQYINTSKYYNTLLQQNQTDDAQKIQYFKSIMETPIDISAVQNMAYMLSPLGIRKNIQMHASQFNISSKNIHIQADYKPHYRELFNYILSKPIQCPEKQTIPIYDLNLTNIQTITFQTQQKLYKWITDYKFDITYYKNILASQHILCNIHNKFSKYDSVNVKKLFQILQQQVFNSFYTTKIKKQLINDLLDNLNQQSMNCSILSIGSISKLSNKTKSLYINNKNLLQTVNSDADIAIENLTKKDNDFYTVNTIPHNSLYVLSLTTPIEHSSKIQKPSAYFNFVNLKNMQTPLQDFEVSIPQIEDASFRIYGNTKQYQSDIFKKKNVNNAASVEAIYNREIAQLYDIDKTKSLLFNDINTKTDFIRITDKIMHAIPNMYVTSSILQSSIKYDQLYRSNKNLSAQYTSIDSQTLKSKIQNYFIPFYQRHIQDNKEYEIGQLHGLRSYIKTGILDDQQNIWLSYKYVTSNSNELNDSYKLIYDLPFKEYQIKRNNYSISSNNLKQAGKSCPYKYTNNNLIGCSSFICQAKISDTCNGACPFLHSQNGVLSSITWSNVQYHQNSTAKNIIKNTFSIDNNNWFYFIPSAKLNYKSSNFCLYANTDLMVSDDIQIYFSNLNFNQFVNFIHANGPFYDSIYGGFGHQGNIKYQDFLLRNNSQIIVQHEYQIKVVSAYMDSLQHYIEKYTLSSKSLALADLFDKPLYFFIDKKYLQNIETPQYYNKLFNQRLIDFFYFSSNNNIRKLLDLKLARLYQSEQFILGYDSEIIPVNTTYYNFYTQNFYKYLKQLVLDENTGLKIKDLPQVKEISNNNLLYNNIKIANNTPFNGPHKIAAGTKLTGFNIRKSNNGFQINGKKDHIRQDQCCYIRVINWWSDSIKCQGKLSIEPVGESYKADPSYNIILDTINSYDHVELIDGFFKSAQRDYKKSNIYSIKITNSGLNPEYDKSVNDFYECLLIRNYAYLKEQYKQFYQFINIQKFNEIQTDNFNKQYLGYKSSLEKIYLANIDEQNIDIVKDYKIYYFSDKENDLLTLQKYKESSCYQYIKGQGGIYILNTELLEKAIKTRKQLRTIFQNAIKDSVHKYMPLHTDLWKIIYK